MRVRPPYFVAIVLLMLAMASLSTGSAIAKSLFSQLGAMGTTSLRVGMAAIILLAFWRPWQHSLPHQDRFPVLFYGLSLGVMNLLFYQSLAHIPIGLAVAIEFSGPLALVVLSSHRLVDFIWVLLAVTGLALLLPQGLGESELSLAGIGYALAAGVCWALYIIAGQRAGHMHGGQVAAWGMSIAAVTVLPLGLPQLTGVNWTPVIVGLGLIVALLSSAIPYSLEILSLKTLPRRTFGILLSLEPVMSTLTGYVILQEKLTPRQALAMTLIIMASAGSTATAKPSKSG